MSRADDDGEFYSDEEEEEEDWENNSEYRRLMAAGTQGILDDMLAELEEDEEDEESAGERAAKFKLPPGEYPDLGDDATYGITLAMAFNNPKPKVASTTRFPDWFAKAQLSEHLETGGFFLNNLTGLIVHRPSHAVVGFMHGFVIRRDIPEVTVLCDDINGELVDMLDSLFTLDGVRLRDGPLRQHAWAGSLDGGLMLYINRIELDPAHRGKSALAAIEPAFSKFCKERGVSSVVALAGYERHTATAKPDAGFKRAKIRDALGELGLKLVGITNYCARTITDPQRMLHVHDCANDLPLREWAKTVNDEGFPELMRKLVTAYKIIWDARNERLPDDWRKPFPYAEVSGAIHAAVQGLRDRDTELLMGRKGDPTHFPLQELQQLLLKHKPLWIHDKKLGKGLRDISDVLDEYAMDKGGDSDTHEHTGLANALLDESVPVAERLARYFDDEEEQMAAAVDMMSD